MNDLLRARLAAADPAAADTGMHADALARQALAAIVATPPVERPAAPPARRARRRLPRLALAAGVVAAGVAAYVVVPTDAPVPLVRTPRAQAAVPPLLAYDPVARPARAVLLDLAARAERQPRHAPGTYDYVRTRGWYLDGNGNGSYQTNVAERRFWVAADGSGRIDEHRTGVEDGKPAYELRRPFGPGELSPPRPVPAGAAALRTRLGAEPDWDAVNWFDAVQGVWGQQAVEPDAQAALLRALADVPGIAFRGETTDRADRRGLALTADSDRRGMEERAILVLDPETGALLDAEVVALDASDLPVDVGSPATFSYTLFLGSGRTPSTEAAPAGQ